MYYIITNEINFTQFEEAINRAGDREVYEKLRENPELMNGQPTATNFKTSKDGTVIADLYNIKEATSTLSPEEMLIDQLNAKQTAIDGVWHQLALNDSLYTLPDTDTDMLMLFDIQRAALKEQLNTLLVQQEALLALESDKRLDAANELLSQNSLIAASNELQVANEKITNDIYFNTYARGNYELNSSQVALLQNLANQCPIIGGRAVFAARSLYESIEPTLYDDQALCQAVGISAKTDTQKSVEKYFGIVPNPSNGNSTLVVQKVFTEATQVEVYNTLGQRLTNIVLLPYETSIELNLSYLNAGIYFVELKQNDAILQTEKLILIH